ncbi:uncharacterized protein LOC110191147 [Drosophila serrata]|uniref:uncharacterized protein LOC110191147 n=1 Tax=Drosophila serrata TaxID=7274 RepID=UPI000A1D1B53|nr:uncharacterized protein LOC110191147 [Drosophila serrata]KAH8375160.1 hypothetical protein KR200_009458 [Drosophila serrata]
MRSILVILLISTLALVQARNLSGSREDYLEDYQDSRRTTRYGPHLHSSIWPCDVADHREAYPLLHKVEKQLKRIESLEIRNQIQDHVVDQLRQCISAGKMDRHCVGRSIGLTMAFINHQWRNQN